MGTRIMCDFSRRVLVVILVGVRAGKSRGRGVDIREDRR